MTSIGHVQHYEMCARINNEAMILE